MTLHFADPGTVGLAAGRLEGQLFNAVALAFDLANPARQTQSAPRTGGLAGWQEKRVIRHIADYASTSIRVAELAAIVRLSPSHFSRACRVSFGMSPHAMVCRYRVDEARRLLRGTDWPLVDIAEACGFADQSHFARMFCRHTGTSPGRWRRAQLRLPSSSTAARNQGD